MNNISPRSLATILWTVLFTVLYMFYFMIFSLFHNSMSRWNTGTRKKNGGLSTQESSTANEEGGPSRIDDIYESGDYEFAADSYSNSTMLTKPIYKIDDGIDNNFSYVCLREDTTHNVCVTKDTLTYFALNSFRWGTVLSASKSSVVSSTEDDKLLAYDDYARGYVHSVPLQAFSNVHMYFKWEKFSLPEEIFIFRELSWFLYTYYLPVIVTLISSIALILVFYVPAFSEQNSDIDTFSQYKAEYFIRGIFALIIILFPSQMILLYNVSTKSSCRNNMSIIIITSTVLYLLIFGLICYLYSLTLKNNSESAVQNNYLYNSYQSYSCNCHKSKSSTVVPDIKGYSFTCPALGANDDTDFCKQDCNVCASSFFIPFVIFGLLLAAYVCLITFVVFFHLLIRAIFEIRKIKVPPFKRYAQVCLHGDMAHGYPLHMRMTIEDSMQLSKLLYEYKKGQTPYYHKHTSNILMRHLYGNRAPGRWRPLRFTLSLINFFLRGLDLLNKHVLHKQH